jgi:DNA mismatch endonuclease, patch repair protein
MRAVHSKDTTPEIIVRKIVTQLGFRYRLHRDDLPGKPDLVFKTKKKIIFINGCFWHGHDCRRGARIPKTNTEYWIKKISRNRERDMEHQGKLRKEEWSVLIIWECEIKDPNILAALLRNFLY